MPATDLNDHPFAAFMAGESYVSPGERAWERWTAKVEKLLGHDLDGDGATDGYCLDDAYGAFEAGDTAEQHVADVREAKAALAKAGA